MARHQEMYRSQGPTPIPSTGSPVSSAPLLLTLKSAAQVPPLVPRHEQQAEIARASHQVLLKIQAHVEKGIKGLCEAQRDIGGGIF